MWTMRNNTCFLRLVLEVMGVSGATRALSISFKICAYWDRSNKRVYMNGKSPMEGKQLSSTRKCHGRDVNIISIITSREVQKYDTPVYKRKPITLLQQYQYDTVKSKPEFRTSLPPAVPLATQLIILPRTTHLLYIQSPTLKIKTIM